MAYGERWSRNKSAASTGTIGCSELSEKVLVHGVRADSGRMGGVVGWWNGIGRVLGLRENTHGRRRHISTS